MTTQRTIDFRDNAHPYAPDSEDYYFSTEDGAKESEYVFLRHNDLPHRMRHTPAMCITELGFGLGLNFCVTLNEWQQHAKPGAMLDYIGIEHTPPMADDLIRALARWPELTPYVDALCRDYPPPIPGVHRLVYPQWRVRLTLYITTAAEALTQMTAPVDAWYLDGFAPAKNPSMWHPDLFQSMQQLSHPHTTFSTYTAASAVATGLRAAGFHVTKTTGFGKKRHMLHGQLNTPSTQPRSQPWFALPNSPTPTRVAIIGGALAGMSCAHALAARGIHTQVFEAHAASSSAQQSAPAALLKPHPSVQPSPMDAYINQGFLHSNRVLSQLQRDQAQADFPLQHGAIEISQDPHKQAQQQRLVDLRDFDTDFVQYLDAPTLSAHCRVELPTAGLYFPTAKTLSPRALITQLQQASATYCDVIHHCRIMTLQRQQDGWTLIDQDENKRGPFSHIILANGHAAQQFCVSQHLPLTALPGQLSLYTTVPSLSPVSMALCYGGYLLPQLNQQHVLGASFRYDTCSTAQRDQDHQHNLNRLHTHLPALAQVLANKPHHTYVGTRTVSPDKMPLVGPLIAPTDFATCYARIAHGDTRASYPPSPYLPGLFVSAAHGSRGLASCLLAADIIAAMLTQTPLPIPQTTLAAIHPSRFLLKQLKRH